MSLEHLHQRRADEIAVTADLLTTVPHDISPLLPGKIVPSTLSSTKSTNAETRAKSVTLLKAIVKRTSDEAILAKIATEILALPKTGKTSSPEHRTVLFNMAAALPPSDSVSSVVVDILPALSGKENNEHALQALSAALIPHLAHLLTSTKATAPAASSALAKELGATKISIRRELSHAVGQAIWNVKRAGQQYSVEGEKLLGILALALEANLKTASTCLPVNASGFLEGYVALALALGPLKGIPAATKLTGSSVIEGVLATAPKPSFVLNDKVHHRLPAEVDDLWLLRSLQCLVESSVEKINTESAR